MSVPAGDVPEFVQAWVKQLLSPEFLAVVGNGDRVDVRLSASRGRVARQPVVTINGGQSEWVDP